MNRTAEEQYLHELIERYVAPLRNQIKELNEELAEQKVKNKYITNFIMKKWNKFENLKPIENDYPIVVVSKKESKKRTVYNLQVVLKEHFLHISKPKSYVFIKWLKLPDYAG